MKDPYDISYAEELRDVMLMLQNQGMKMPLTAEAIALIAKHPELFKDVWAADSILKTMSRG